MGLLRKLYSTKKRASDVAVTIKGRPPPASASSKGGWGAGRGAGGGRQRAATAGKAAAGSTGRKGFPPAEPGKAAAGSVPSGGKKGATGGLRGPSLTKAAADRMREGSADLAGGTMGRPRSGSGGGAPMPLSQGKRDREGGSGGVKGPAAAEKRQKNSDGQRGGSQTLGEMMATLTLQYTLHVCPLRLRLILFAPPSPMARTFKRL